MKQFAALYESLDGTMSTNAKVAAMVQYFQNVSSEDAAWAVFFLSGRRMKRLISSRSLSTWFLEKSAMPGWLYEEAYSAVGDTAETISLLNEPHGFTEMNDQPLSVWMNDRILPLAQEKEPTQKQHIFEWWNTLAAFEVFILNKMLTGSFRIGVSQQLLVKALANVSKIEPAILSHRLMGHWEPTAVFYQELIDSDSNATNISQPYPFCLASPLEQEIQSLGDVSQWMIEWKWDGIRAQYIKRAGELFIWSRGEDLLNGRFPELEAIAEKIPDGMVLDGEILVYDSNKQAPMPFALLQTRIGRKTVGKKLLEDAPVAFIAYDLLEYNERDIRQEALSERRALLSELVEQIGAPFILSPAVTSQSWLEATQLREESRAREVEGFLLKRLDSPYETGRKRGNWWKWKIDPFTIDAVLIYAQAGTGKRANLFTDYTFAVWDEDKLVPIAKAYSGLSNAEIDQLDRWIRNHTVEKFGPVRSVKAEHVFELAFEGIAESKRHKSGVAVRFPRIKRWRTDKPMAEANTLADLKALIHAKSLV